MRLLSEKLKEINTMFYIRTDLNASIQLQADLHSDNVYCRCPDCGDEVQVDLAELFRDGEGDMETSTVVCEKCTKARLEAAR
jgi:uncharacterized protein with PIN domain